jgi:DNA topoisomerase-2
MYLIGPNGAVKKYNSPEEILMDYMEIRIGTYKKRKAHLLKQLDAEIQWLSEKARFISDVAVTPKIHVFNTPLAQIESQLRREKYDETIWSKLLDIKTYQYTREEVTKLRDLCTAKIAEREKVKATPVAQMWKNNLHDL